MEINVQDTFISTGVSAAADALNPKLYMDVQYSMFKIIRTKQIDLVERAKTVSIINFPIDM